ncbi:MAG: response regulator [Candidatus Cloacimonetes bacterium]|nr:response regulator [Candidatus Cloacimonadota bacterium]
MQNSKILIVDDEVDVARIISARLKQFGYNANSASSGAEALKLVSEEPPDLIITDLLMPEMDGYELTSQLRSNPVSAQIPIMMLTAKVSQQDKIKALNLGIDDYITKPYDAQELAARIDSVLRRAERSTTPEGERVYLSDSDKKRVSFIQMLLEKGETTLQPRYNMQSRTGYYYKTAADYFGLKDGTELEELHYLMEKGVFSRVFYDNVMLCPNCGHHNLNIREVAPQSKSADINLESTIHHYPCGYVGAENEFLRGVQYICPKCQRELNSIGVDYDRPGEIYICNDTGEKFAEPEVEAQCRNCQRKFEIDSVSKMRFFTFHITDKGEDVAQRGSFIRTNFEEELMDMEVAVYNTNYFRQKFMEELARARRFNRQLTLVLVEITDAEAIIREKGLDTFHRIVGKLASILKESLWNVDIPARFDKNTFISLLPEADSVRAQEVIDTIYQQASEELETVLNLNIRAVSYPEDGATTDELLESLIIT